MENDLDLLSKIIFKDLPPQWEDKPAQCENMGSYDTHATLEIKRNSPKVNVFCTVCVSFFFEGPFTSEQTYLKMFQT